MAQRPSMTVKDSERFIPNPVYLPQTVTAIDLKTRSNIIDLGEGDWKIEGTTVSATAAQINRKTVNAETMIAAGSTKTLTIADADKLVLLDTAAGSTITLPAASGTGARYRFVVSALATSNSHIVKVANSSDAMQGSIFTMSDDAGAPVKGYFAVAGTSDTITLNRTTTGSVTIGEVIEIIDIATNKFQVSGFTSSTGTEATPFSATV